MLKFTLWGLFILTGLYIIGRFPPLSVAASSVIIVFLFLIFGGDK